MSNQNYWAFFLHQYCVQFVVDREKFTVIVFKLGFTPCKAEQPLRGIELQEKKAQKDYSIQEICLERTYS